MCPVQSPEFNMHRHRWAKSNVPKRDVGPFCYPAIKGIEKKRSLPQSEKNPRSLHSSDFGLKNMIKTEDLGCFQNGGCRGIFGGTLQAKIPPNFRQQMAYLDSLLKYSSKIPSGFFKIPPAPCIKENASSCTKSL